MNKRITSVIGALALYGAMAVSANAAVLTYIGEVTSATGAFVALTPVGTPVGGPIDVATGPGGTVGVGDYNAIDVTVGGFCFSLNGNCGGAGTLVPITSIDASAIALDGLGNVSGGSFAITAFSATFNVSIPIMFDLDAGTFFADGGALGTVSGTGNFQQTVVPVPAAVWLFGSALLGLVGLRRRS